ncbi:unnamed protein product [Caretta caretta]
MAEKRLMAYSCKRGLETTCWKDGLPEPSRSLPPRPPDPSSWDTRRKRRDGQEGGPRRSRGGGERNELTCQKTMRLAWPLARQ